MSYIRCPTCSYYLGFYFEFFEEAKKAIYNTHIYNDKSPYANYDTAKIAFNSKIMPDLQLIFDALEIPIKQICCRKHFTASVKPDMSYG